MATDLPQYKNQSPIKPSATGSDANAAFSGLTNAALQTVNAGSQLSQDAANRIAASEGRKAAQEGRAILPEFTQAGAHFEHAYETELKQSLGFQANKLLQTLNHEASKNPNQQSLDSFKKHSLGGMQELLNMAPERMRSELGRHFESTYDANYLQLAKAVEAENKKQLMHRFQLTSDENGKTIQNFHLNGNNEAAKVVYESQLQNIQNAVANRLIDKPTADYQKGVARLDYFKSYYTGQALQAEEKGKGDEYLADMVKTPPLNLEPTEVLQVASSIKQFLDTRRSTQKGQQYITYNHALQDLQQGTLTQSKLADYKRELSAQQFSDLELEIGKQSVKAAKSQALFKDMSSKVNTVMGANQFTGEQIDSYFKNLVTIFEQDASEKSGQDVKATLLDKARIAERIKAPIASLKDDLQMSIRYADPQTALEAARAIRMLKHNNPVNIDGIDKNSLSTAHLYDLHSRDTSRAPLDSLNLARGDVYNVDENAKKDRAAALKAWSENKELGDYSKKMKFIAKNLGFKTPILGLADVQKLPDGIGSKFDELISSYMMTTKDPNVAAQMVFEELNHTYPETDINLKSQRMRNAPEKFLPKSSYEPEYSTPSLTELLDPAELDKYVNNIDKAKGRYIMQNDKLRALKEVVLSNENAKKEGRFTFNELSWPNAPTDEQLENDILDGGAIILVNGQRCTIEIAEDIQTSLSEDGMPSWAFVAIDSKTGMQIPLMDLTKEHGMARWRPDYKKAWPELKKTPPQEFQEYKRQQLEKTKQQRLSNQQLDEIIVNNLEEGY